MTSPNIIIRRTLLSAKPKKNAGLVALISVALLFVASQIYWNPDIGWSSNMAAIPVKVFQGNEYWRLFTSIGAHSDLGHVLSNAASFGVLAYLIYGYFGPVLYPVCMAVAGALVNLLSLLTYPDHTSLVGASGVVYLMGSFWLTMYVCIDRRFSIAKRLLRALGLALIFFLPTSYRPEVSERTHAIGFGIGILIGCFYFFANRKTIRSYEVLEIEEEHSVEPLWN